MKGAKECGTESAQNLQYLTYNNEHHSSFVNILHNFALLNRNHKCLIILGTSEQEIHMYVLLGFCGEISSIPYSSFR